MAKQSVNFRTFVPLVQKIDKEAEKLDRTRSEYISACLENLERAAKAKRRSMLEIARSLP